MALAQAVGAAVDGLVGDRLRAAGVLLERALLEQAAVPVRRILHPPLLEAAIKPAAVRLEEPDHRPVRLDGAAVIERATLRAEHREPAAMDPSAEPASAELRP